MSYPLPSTPENLNAILILYSYLVRARECSVDPPRVDMGKRLYLITSTQWDPVSSLKFNFGIALGFLYYSDMELLAFDIGILECILVPP